MCGEVRAINRAHDVSLVTNCASLKDTLCGDYSDDLLEFSGGWVRPRELKNLEVQ